MGVVLYGVTHGEVNVGAPLLVEVQRVVGTHEDAFVVRVAVEGLGLLIRCRDAGLHLLVAVGEAEGVFVARSVLAEQAVTPVVDGIFDGVEIVVCQVGIDVILGVGGIFTALGVSGLVPPQLIDHLHVADGVGDKIGIA